MPKATVIFSCSACGAQYPAWQGRCSECGQWGTIREEAATAKAGPRTRRPSAETVPLASVQGSDRPYRPTGIAEFDRVLSGGLVDGSLLLLGGNPGIGKSTLILQVAAAVAESGIALYVSGEESKEQLKLRYDRLGLDAPNLHVLSETDVATVVETVAQRKPALAIIDSIQTMSLGDVVGEPGGITQIKAATVRLLECAKTSGTPIVLIGHVTKEGFVAGPKMLEHLVDTVLYLEGDDSQAFRLLRTAKHRFGVTDEVGVFSMTDRGLAGVANPSDLFLLDTRSTEAGSSVTAVVEGTRPFLVEVQALVSATTFGYPRRLASGFDRSRLELLIAVLVKRAGLALAAQDVHVNLVGGLKVKEPALDLAVALAVASGFRNVPLDAKLVLIGEIGLGGEVRPVARMEQRLSEAAKLGFTRAVIAASGKPKKTFGGLVITSVRTVGDAINACLQKKK